MIDRCVQRDELVKAVSGVLNKIVALTTGQLDAFHRNDEAGLARLDKELENTFGAKERAIGALQQHEKEHGCGLTKS